MENDLINKIKSQKSIAMLAPAFVIDFPYPNIIGMLEKLGLSKVTELTFGARMVNWWYAEYIKEHPDQKYYIASPCPTIVAFVKAKYPDLMQYLMPFASPMLAQARIIKKHYPDYQTVFIAPCFAKQNIEAPQHRDVVDIAITFKELKSAFDEAGIYAEDFERQYQFDSMIQEYTKVYPVSGGLAKTSHIAKYFGPDEVFINEGIVHIEPVLKEMQAGTSRFRFLDVLNCEGGCIGGPAIVNQSMSIEERKRKVRHYVEESSERAMGPHAGKLDYADGVDMGVKL